MRDEDFKKEHHKFESYFDDNEYKGDSYNDQAYKAHEALFNTLS